ncbi:DNA oxidative demethylase AlkB [Ideonella sp. YS5]|uniref:DNA oxidative demethylase AlkB n=1 Tax=Ideonella sp. YS5 TaxID=3453714 RepID=UPI003EE8E2BC
MHAPAAQDSLFEHPAREAIAPGAWWLHGFARGEAARLLTDVQQVLAEAPLRHLVTPGGYRMSVAMSNCGPLGWVSDGRGYRYSPTDPDSGRPWPAMPTSFRELATRASQAAGFEGFMPDACLINRYEPGARLTLHQDRDEQDHGQPIVSVSLGLPAVFLFGGLKRSERPRRLSLVHGDVVVWGGPSRLAYHGVLPVGDAAHPATGRCRINLTFRRAG